MPAETRFLRADAHTVNGLTAYVLGKEPSVAFDSLGISVYLAETYADQYLAMEVCKRSKDGKEASISGGLIGEVKGNDTGLLTAKWKCPKVDLAPTDAIVLHVYRGTSSPPSNFLASFITEPLGAKSLDEAEWTINLMLERKYEVVDSQPITTYSLLIGAASFIDNFTWTPYVLIAGLMPQVVQIISATLIVIFIVSLLRHVARALRR
jgi:hypothetical protein